MRDGKKQRRKSGWGYRIFLGLSVILITALGGILLLYLSLPFLAEYFGKRWIAQKLEAPVEISVEAMTPWQTRVNSFAVDGIAGSLNFSLNEVEVRYDLDSIQKPSPIKYLGIQRGAFEFPLDPYLEPSVTVTRANSEESGIPSLENWPVQKWSFDQLIMRPTFKEKEWQAELRGYGLFEAPALEQAMEVKISELDLTSRILGNLDVRERDWSLDWEAEVGDPRKAFEEMRQIFDLPSLPEPISWSWDNLTGEGRIQGQSSKWKRFHSFVEGGSGILEWAGGNLQVEGLAGVVLVDDPNWNSTFARLHLLISSLELESLFESREFAIELHKMRNRELLSQVGPLSLRWEKGNLEMEVVGKTRLHSRGAPTHLEVHLKSPAFHHRDGRADLSGSGEATVYLQEESAKETITGKLKWDLNALQGFWEPVFIESFSSRGSFQNLELPISSLTSLLSDWRVLQEIDWIKKLEDEIQGEAYVDFEEISIPGQVQIEKGEFSLERKAVEKNESSVQVKLNSHQTSLGGFSVRGLELLGFGNREKGTVQMALLKPSGGRAEAKATYQSSASQEYAWEINVPRVHLKDEGWLGGINPTFVGSKLRGDFEFSGSGRYQRPIDWDGSGLLHLQALDFEWPAQNMKLEGLNSRLKISGFNPISLPEGQLIKINRLKKGDLEATDLRLKVGKKKEGAVQISGLQGRIFDGSVAADRLEIDLENPTFQLVLHLNGIVLEKVALLAKDFPGKLQGKVNGVLRIGWDGKEISFGRGYLELVPGTEGLLELHLDRKPSQEKADPYAFLQNLAQQRTAVESLRLVRLESARFDLFNPENPENPNQLRLKGVSLSLEPQTPVDITLNLKEDVEESIRQLIKVFLSAT